MTGDDPPERDDGHRADTLFASFPDPLLAYAGEGAEASDAAPASPVVRAVNPAFEATFGVGADSVGASLDDVALPGTLVTGGDEAVLDRSVTDGDGKESTDDGDGEESADDGAVDTDAADGGSTAPEPPTTVGSMLRRVRGDADRVLLRGSDADGVRRTFHVRAVAVGEGTGGSLLFTDVSTCEERRRELASTVERLERIADVVGHDVRNPLEVARIRLEAARESGDAVHFEKVAGALDRIERIVGDVFTAGVGDVDPTDTVALVDVAEAAWDTVDTTDAALVTTPAVSALTVRADADRLQRLFENLFRNSVEHGSTGRRAAPDDAVEQNGRDVTVTVDALPTGFVVADDGPGVPREVHEHAFEAGTTTTPGNSGLGLSIVDRVARGHGWQVSLVTGDATTDAGDAGGSGGGARFEFTGVEIVDRGSESASADDGG
jgi:signal transduction histidine kinase